MSDVPDTQAAIIRALCLLLQKQYDDKVEIIETHISVILLVNAFAYKIKKPVDFGFLDFTSLEKRHVFCNEELRLNRRLAPAYYLGVDRITLAGKPARVQINGEGEVIEYMVKMRRFEPGGQLDALLQQNRLTHHHLDELADIIADFHTSVAVASETDFPGLVSGIENAVIQNFEQVSPYLALFSDSRQSALHALEDWSRHQLKRLKPAMQKRLAQGYVRECHGDMHSGNITLDEAQLVIFDAIEFNPGFRWIDVMSEMAFISMDLEFNNRADLAYRLLNAYLEKTGDYHGLQVLRFYQVYRCMVRAKVNCLRLSQLAKQAPEYRETLNTVYRYLELAQHYTRETTTCLIITRGVSGSGKSHTSLQLLQNMHMIRIRSDVERKRLFPQQQNRYQPSATEKTYGYLHKLAEKLLGYGYPVILDATYLKKSFRSDARQIALDAPCRFYILSLSDDRSVLEKRIIKRRNSPNNASEATIDILHTQLDTLEKLDDEEDRHAVLIDNNETVVETFRNHLAKH